jgi:hypothetical protein
VPDKLRRHLASVDAYVRNPIWLDLPTGDQRDNWRRCFTDLQMPEFNGRWAAYKTSELLQKVLAWPVEPTDAGHEHSTGPLQGLLTLDPTLQGQPVGVLDDVTEELRIDIEDHLSRPTDVAEVETILCDWHSLLDGRYYVGHDIDQMQTAGNLCLSEFVGDPAVPPTRALINNARKGAFEGRWLGEESGWRGVRKDLRGLYRRDRRIRWWEQ